MKRLLLAVLGLASVLAAHAQCPDVTATRKKVSSSFHSSLMIDYTGVVQYWGQSSHPTTGATAASPGVLSTSLYSGTPLAVAATSVTTTTHTMYLLTSSALYGWGAVNGSTVSSIATMALPTTLNGSAFNMTAANIEFITSAGGGVAIVTKIDATTNGEVFVYQPAGTGGGSVYTYGDSTTTFNSAWHQVKTGGSAYLQGVTKLSFSQKAMMAIGTNNAVYAWGEKVWVGSATTASDNYFATLVTGPASVTPVDVNIISRTAYDASAAFSSQFILGSNGQLYAKGEGFHGVLGQGNETDQTSWVTVKNETNTGALTNIVQISSNNTYVYSSAYYSMGALNSNGQLYLWGDNSYSMIGGTATHTLLPGLPPNFNVNDARVGYFCMGGHTTLAFLQGSNRFCYIGHRTQGSMGDGTTVSVTKSFYDCINTPSAYACPPPAPLGCPASSAHELIASSVNGTLVINGQPAASYWGQGASSAEGGVSTPVPVTLYEYTGVPLGVAASGVSTTTSGTQMWILSTTGLWGWGYSANTINTAAAVTSLTKMTLPSGVTIGNVAFIRSSKGGLALVTTSGAVWIKAGAGSACDASVYGDGSTTLDNNWHQVTTAASTPLTGITEMSFGGSAAMAIAGNGNVYVWGVNTSLGNSTAAATRTRAALMTLHSDFTALMTARKAEIIQTSTSAAAQFLIGANGKIYSLGGNVNGVLGIGNTTTQTGWSVLSLTNVTKLSSNNPFPDGYYSIGALTATGTLYLWGSNANGMLGGGSTTSYNVPTIPALTALGASVTATDNINGFEMGGQQTIIFTKPMAANPDNKFLFAGVNAGGAKGDVNPAPATSNITAFAFGASVINCAGAVYNLSGNVYYDANGVNDAGGGLISGPAIATASGAPALYANLLDDAGIVINTTPVAANGSYSFLNLPAANYTIQISNTAGALFNPATPATLPDAWAFVGEQIGTVAGTDLNSGVNNKTGKISVTLGAHTTNVNIGLERRPVADAKSFTVQNTAFRGQNTPPANFPVRTGYKAIPASSTAFSGYSASGNGSLSGTDAEDCPTSGSCNTGSARSFKIDAINPNTELWYYNGTTAVQVLAGQTIANFNVNNLVVYGQMGSGSTVNPLGFSYRLIDAAGAESLPVAYSITTGATALPAVVLEFGARLTPECGSALNWTSGVESGVKAYGIQHSTDGRGFAMIGRVDATGAGSSYRFVHPAAARGANYYRLVIEDLDGSISFSQVESVNANCLSRSSLGVAPNPTGGKVLVSGVLAGDRITVYTPVGTVALSQGCSADGSANVDLGSFPAGIYILKLQDAAGEAVISIRLQKY